MSHFAPRISRVINRMAGWMIGRDSAIIGLVGGLLATPVFMTPAFAAPNQGKTDLAAHRAVYDLKLSLSRGRRPIDSVRGRILYDFSGNPCDGYALNFRQVSEIDTGEGKVLTSDLRAATWEEAGAKSFRFNSQNFLDQRLVDNVDGKAERKTAGVDINLSKPHSKHFNIDTDVIFPTEHMRRIIAAAQAGKSLLEIPVYDGSETGEKIYDTLTVIGHPIPPDIKMPNDAAKDQVALAKLMRWPVSIGYFDKSKQGGEQTPIYSISFELYENGISRALALDYNDFVITGEMTSIEIKPAASCAQ